MPVCRNLISLRTIKPRANKNRARLEYNVITLPKFTEFFNNLLPKKRYTPICFTVKVVFTPPPSVTPTASKAESAISITSPALSAIIILPL